MSALSNYYIHLTAKNYSRLGLQDPFERNEKSYDSFSLQSYWLGKYISTQHNLQQTNLVKIKQEGNQLTKLEGDLNAAIMSLQQLEPSELQKIKDKLLDNFFDRFSDSAQRTKMLRDKVSVNLTTMEFKANEGLIGITSAIEDDFKQLKINVKDISNSGTSTPQVEWETNSAKILKYRDILINILNNYDRGSIENALKVDTDICNAINSLNTLIDGDLQVTGASLLSQGRKGYKKNKTYIDANLYNKAMTAIATAVSNFQISKATLNTLGGNFFEFVMHYAKYYIQSKAIENFADWLKVEIDPIFNKHLNKSVGGQLSSKSHFDAIPISKVAGNILKKNNQLVHFLKQEKIINGIVDKNGNKQDDIKYSISLDTSSQQKADLTLRLRTENGGLYPKGFSLKSTRLTGDNKYIYTKLVSESPLTSFLLGNFNRVDFFNFLNILSYHDDDEEVSGYKESKEMAIYTLKLSIINGALTGRGVGKREGFADYMMIQNKDDGSIKIINSGDVLNKIVTSDFKNVAIKVDNNTLDNNTVTLFENKKVIYYSNIVDAEVRMSQVLAEAHSKKIKASIQNTYFI